jgi:hypothetical protein
MLRVSRLPAISTGKNGIAARRIDKKPGLPQLGRSLFIYRLDLVRVIGQYRHADDPGAFMYAHARAAGTFEQQMVEFRSTYFERMRWTVTQCIRKVEDLFFVATVANGKIRTVLGYADFPDFAKNTEAIEDWQVHRKQGLADMKSRMRIFLQEYYVVASFSQECADCGSGRSATHYDYISLNFHHVLRDRILAN